MFRRFALAMSVAVALPVSAGADDAKERPSGRILVSALKRNEKDPTKPESWMLELDPKTGNWREVVQGEGALLRPPPGGKWLVSRGRDGTRLVDPRGKDKSIRILDDTRLALVAWSPDGKRFLAVKGLIERVPSPGAFRYETWRFDADGKNPTKLPIPETDQVLDWSPDGHWLLTVSGRHPEEGRQIYRMHPDGTEPRRLTREGHNRNPRFSPDGGSILFHRSPSDRSNEETVWVMDADGSNPKPVYDVPAVAARACWSPDGKRVAIRVLDLRRNPDGTVAPGVPADAKVSHPRIEVMDLGGDHHEIFPFPAGFFHGNPEWIAGG